MAKNGHVLTTGEAAQRLGLGPERVRQLANAGALRCRVTETGRRVYLASDVEAERKRRERRKGRA